MKTETVACPACGVALEAHCARCDWGRCPACQAGPFRMTEWVSNGGMPQTQAFKQCRFLESPNKFGIQERCGRPMLAILTEDASLFHWCPRHDWAPSSA